MPWYDFFKIFNYAFTQDPLSLKKDTRSLPSAGHSTIDNFPNLKGDVSTSGTNSMIRVQNDLIDQNTTANRTNRYKEYDRLVASVPEIDMAMTVFADEACVAASTEIETVFHGPVRIDELVKNKNKERFPVYAFDFNTGDYTIGWAFDPRFVKSAKTIHIMLENGEVETVTEDHRILLRDGMTWRFAGDLKFGDELMPFHRINANYNLTKLRSNQYPRIFTFKDGWVNERQFIDEWRLGRDLPDYETPNYYSRLIASKLSIEEIIKITGKSEYKIEDCLHKYGFSIKEIKYLAKKHLDRRRIIGVAPGPVQEVFDLSVEGHENFCTKNLVMHNCQKNEDGKVFKITCENKEVVDELEFLFFHRNMLNFNQRVMWDKMKRFLVKGDSFWELLINLDNPKEGILGIQDLPPETMFRIETTKSKLLEFQQTNEQPDYQAVEKAPIDTATDAELAQSLATRFSPKQVIHTRLGDFRKTFYPYGVSLIEPARGPAHQLRMLEDAMVIYRLTRAPERRIFYIDVGTLPSHKVEAFMDRIKDQFRKKKVVGNRGYSGANAVEEKYHAPAQDEDFWVPTRAGSNTKIDVLPGASNLGEIDDTVYFRNKLFVSMNFPKNYFATEDPNSTRITLSSQDVKFARLVERFQSYFEDSLWEIADRHLTLRGFPQESYEDLNVKMTPPSDWRELSRNEVVSNRINNVTSLKGSQLLADFDLLTKWMKYTEDEANEMISRNKIQKLEDLKMAVLAQNPIQLGVGNPTANAGQELGAEPGGPNPMLGPDQAPDQGMPGQPPPDQGPPGQPPQGLPPMPPPPQADMMPPAEQAKPLPDPSDEEISRYDLDIQDYDSEIDFITRDMSEDE